LLRKSEAAGDATYPPARASKLNSGLRLTGLLGLAGGGVCPAGAVTDAAVRSYRTISPLPPLFCFACCRDLRRETQRQAKSKQRGLCIFCGTFPRVAPGGR